MTILAIDPGPESSAWVIYGFGPIQFAKQHNEEVLKLCGQIGFDKCVIEQVACMGMAVGAEVFETVFWSGRFAERFGIGRVDRVKRHEVKMHLCGHPRAKDANIRQAIIDKYGGKERAIGKKHSPGPLYGISGDCWSALAIAITYSAKFSGTVKP